MTPTDEKTVGEIAVEYPAALRVFEKHHIDYGCGGKHSIGDACRVAGASVEEVMEEVARASAAPAAEDGAEPSENRDWNHASLGELIRYMEVGHHAWLSEELMVIEQLIDRASESSADGNAPPNFVGSLRRVFGYLRSELEGHMRKEEKILFPAIARMENSVAEGGSVLPAAFGSLANPIAMMEQEHDVAAQYLDELRDLTYGYNPPEDAPQSLRALCRELQVLEADLRTDIHLENNILFPRAIRLELRSCAR